MNVGSTKAMSLFSFVAFLTTPNDMKSYDEANEVCSNLNVNYLAYATTPVILDLTRSVSRYVKGKHDNQILVCICRLLLTKAKL